MIIGKLISSTILAVTVSLASTALCTAQAPAGGPPPPDLLPLGFFVTSVGVGDGANLGGLAGADAHCQMLAENVDSGNRSWKAYLSTQATDATPAVNAIDRIGSGPWGNAKGIEIASNPKSLMYDNSNINHEHALSENGDVIRSRAFDETPNQHDILTGTQINGQAFATGEDKTCSNWTDNSDNGKAHVGHSDRHRGSTPGSGWNSSHETRGCSQSALEGTGGAGLFYCFATD